MSAETTPRDRLVAFTAALRREPGEDIDVTWARAETFVAALEAAPDVPVQCPCCEKLAVLCLKHYLMHAPDRRCAACWDES